MIVNYSGWSLDRGSFYEEIFVDEKKTDYAIQYANGSCLKQDSSFQMVAANWNCDGDVYSQFGAWFDNGSCREFFTPDDLVRMAIEDVNDANSSVKAIIGLDLSSLNKRPSLETAIQESEAKALMRDVERNRKLSRESNVVVGTHREGEER